MKRTENMKRTEFAPYNNGNTARLFEDIVARVERVGATARMLLGRTAVEEQVERPAQAAIQASPTPARKLSFRGWMARDDSRVAVANPTPENTLRATNSARHAALEALNPGAPINQISSPANANKATYDWGAHSVQVAPAVIGGDASNVYHNPARPDLRRVAPPMEIRASGYFYTQQELDALNQMPAGDGLLNPEQFGAEQPGQLPPEHPQQ